MADLPGPTAALPGALPSNLEATDPASLNGILPRRRLTSTEHAYATLWTALMRGELAPGTRLAQNDIAAKLNMSTTPVREAFRRLESEGLIEIGSYRGAVVRGLDRDRITEVYDLRMILEPLAIERSVPHLTPKEFKLARAFHHDMIDAPDVSDWVEANRKFHDALICAEVSPILNSFVQTLRNNAVPYVRLSILLDDAVIRQSGSEHLALLEACESGDAKLASAIEQKHLARTLRTIKENLGRQTNS